MITLIVAVLFLAVPSIAQDEGTSFIKKSAASFRMPELIEPAAGKKSVLLAVGLSLILPGAGEYYAGRTDYAVYPMAAEGALWLTYAGMNTIGSEVKNDARSYAQIHSGARFDGKEDQFEVNIGNFTSWAEYNNQKMRNREVHLLYPDLPEYKWEWDSDANRQSFKDQRVQGDQVLLNAKYVLSVMALNRVVSAFMAGRAASAYNKAQETESFGLSVGASRFGMADKGYTVHVSIGF